MRSLEEQQGCCCCCCVCVCVEQVGNKESVQITIWTMLKVETPIRNSIEWAIGYVSLELSIASGLEIEILGSTR